MGSRTRRRPRGMLHPPACNLRRCDFRLNAGGVAADIEVPTLGAACDPLVALVSTVYGEVAGQPRTLPGFELHLRTRTVRLAAAVDLKRALGIPGLAHGAARAVKDAERVAGALRGVGAREVVIAIRGVEDAGT